MEYRTVYTDKKVIESVPNDNFTVTGSLQKFMIDTIPETIIRLAGWGINVSFLWKNGLADRLLPSAVSPEVAISAHPLNAEISRKVFVHSLTVDQANSQFRLNVIVRHFDEDGNHLIDGDYDDELASILIDNSKLVEGIGEFDYFVSLVNQGANLFQLQPIHIGIMDSNGRFNDIYN